MTIKKSQTEQKAKNNRKIEIKLSDHSMKLFQFFIAMKPVVLCVIYVKNIRNKRIEKSSLKI